MHPDFSRLIQDAAEHTRRGDLRAATAAIQAALGASAGAAAAQAAGDVIDVQARVVPDAPAPGAARTALPPWTGAMPPAAPAATRPREESFAAGRFGTGPAARDYKLYVPPGDHAGPLPLVVMLHGCTQDPDDFAAGTGMNEAARAQGLYVLYPAQSAKANPQRCWNWFKHSHQQRGRGEPAVLAGMVREVMARHAIDPARVYVAGLSAGGAMAAILGDTYADLFAAVAVHSGLPAGAARDLPSALEAMKSGAAGAPPAAPAVPTIVFHGDADRTVHPANGRQAYGHGADAVQAEPGRAPGGRTWTRRVRRDAAGRVVAEHWEIHGAGHAWAGGSKRGSYTDPQGPDATAEMLRFFGQHRRG